MVSPPPTAAAATHPKPTNLVILPRSPHLSRSHHTAARAFKLLSVAVAFIANHRLERRFVG